jgi:phosphate uptake regulator
VGLAALWIELVRMGRDVVEQVQRMGRVASVSREKLTAQPAR